MSLSAPNGPYEVSTVELEIPARDPRVFEQGKFLLGGKDAFRLETVLLTIFYPTSKRVAGQPVRSKSGASWLPQPKLRSVEGLIKYGKIPKIFTLPAAFLLPFTSKLPYIVNGPLATQAPPTLISAEAGDERNAPSSAKPSPLFPVGIFSHGLAGSKTTYSNYLASLASEGMVIAAVEHRDGSGPATTIHYPAKDGSKAREEALIYFKHSELDANKETGDPTSSEDDMRTVQLKLRQAEVQEALHVLNRINGGEGDDLVRDSTVQGGQKGAKLSEWEGKLDLASTWMLGHSFGGATAIEMIRANGSPFRHALVLDPWLEPIAKAGETTPLKRPLFCINSEHFTVWRAHFKQVRELVSEAKAQTGQGWLLTMTKTKHTDFSDFPFLMPRLFKTQANPHRFHTLLSEASTKQFSGAFSLAALSLPTREEIDGEVEARDMGEPGQVVHHPLLEGQDARL